MPEGPSASEIRVATSRKWGPGYHCCVAVSLSWTCYITCQVSSPSQGARATPASPGAMKGFKDSSGANGNTSTPPNPPHSLQHGAETGTMAHCPSAPVTETGFLLEHPVCMIPPGELQARPHSKEVQLRQLKAIIKPLFF